MEMIEKAVAPAAKVQGITADLLTRQVGRADVIRATWLALVSGRPAFFLGPPGVDKTGTVQALAGRIEGAVFFDALMPTVASADQLLVEATSIEETVAPDGGKSIRTRDTLGRAASAHLVFADEIWKAEPRVLQTLIDLSKGDGVRHEGTMVRTPLMAFLAASNELPDPEGNLGAVWSRMTIRVAVSSLDRAGKAGLVASRLARDRAAGQSASAKLTLTEVATLRAARPHVGVQDEIVKIVLDLYSELAEEKSADFAWLWADDRRFGRVFDVMQAKALLDGRSAVGRQDLAVLEWLLWDTTEHIPVVRAKLAPYTRTALTDAQEVVDTLLSPSGTVETVCKGDRGKGVQAIQQCESALCELDKARVAATDDAMRSAIEALTAQVNAKKQDVIAVVTGAKRATA